MTLVSLARRRWPILLGGVLLARLLLALALCRQPTLAYYPDSYGYERLAQGILHGTAYLSSPIDPTDLFRPPGYPGFIALIYGLMGPSPVSVALVQLTLSGVTAWLVLGMGKLLHSERAGGMGAILLALDPLTNWWSLALLSDVLFSFLLSLGFFLCVSGAVDRRYGKVMVSGLVTGIAVLVRPIGLILGLLWVASSALFRIPSRMPTRRLLLSWALLVGFCGATLPWAVRNGLVWGQLTISSVSSYNVAAYLAPAAIAERDGVSLEEARIKVAPPPGWPVSEDGRWYRNVILANLGPYMKAHAKGTLATLFGLEYAGWFRLAGIQVSTPGLLVAIQSGSLSGIAYGVLSAIRNSPAVTLALLGTLGYQLLMYLTACVGTWKMLENPRFRWAAVLMLVTVGAILLIPGPVGEPRFRVPAQPFIAVLGGVGLARLSQPSRAGETPNNAGV